MTIDLAATPATFASRSLVGNCPAPRLCAVGEAADPRPAMRWLTASLTHFAPGPGPAWVDARAMTKRCTELALTHSYVRTWVDNGSLPADPFGTDLEAWRSALEGHCTEQTPGERAGEDAADGLFHAQPYLWLRTTGYRLQSWEEELARLSAAAVRPGSVGIVHCLWKAGLVRSQPDWHRALVRWLTAWNGADHVSDHDAYRVTHAAFYITDLGNQDAPVEAADRDRLVDIARNLLGSSAVRGRWDLVGELLVALTCLGSDDAYQQDAARAFCAERALSAPAAAQPVASAGDETPEQRDEAFRRGYHTTMVDVLRCAVSTHRAAGRAFPREGEGTP